MQLYKVKCNNLTFMSKKNNLSRYLRNSCDVISQIDEQLDKINQIADLIKKTKKNRKKILICGNGGSYSEAEHLATELVCTYDKKNRKPIPAYLLGSNAGSLTAWSNDFEYESYLCREIEAIGSKNDILIIFTTSGGNENKKQSKNLLNIAKLSKKKGLKVISITGKKGGDIIKYSSLFIHIKNEKTSHIQEAHLVILHLICEILEK